MFKMTDNALSPNKAHYQRALKILEASHVQAHDEGMAHIHEAVHTAAEQEGLLTAPITLERYRGLNGVSIDDSPDGDKLFDAEYGTPTQGPNAVLRTAARAAHPAGQAIYRSHLRRALGI